MSNNKKNKLMFLILGIVIFIVSYSLDSRVSSFFKTTDFALLDYSLGSVTNFGVLVIVALVIPAFILYKKNKGSAYALLAAFACSFIFAFIAKLIFLRQRPINAFTFPFTGIINYSFPSMHAMVAFSLLPILAKHLPRQRHFWIAFVILVSFSRIYFNFHFLSDVVFGAFVGYIIGYCILEYYERKYEKRK